MPVADELTSVGEALAVDPMTWVLGGGDDHAFVATFPSSGEVPTGWTTIGEVVPIRSDAEGACVRVDEKPYTTGGYDHFA